MCIVILSACLCATCVSGAHGSQDPVEKCFQPLSYAQHPMVILKDNKLKFKIQQNDHNTLERNIQPR